MVKKFSIIIDDSLFERVEAARGEKARTDYIKEMIEGYFVTQKSPNDNPESSAKMIEFLQTEIVFLRSQLSEMDKLLSQEQSLHLQTQKQIMPTQEEQKEKGKHFWEFWKH
jgi:metal-responsive CopG/Arc/MetJ family transcriptional regulator